MQIVRFNHSAVGTGQLDQRSTSVGLHVSRINNRQTTGPKPLGRDEVEQFKGIGGCTLIVLVVRDESARQKSEDTISVGLKCFLANVDFPLTDAPIRITSDNSGISIFIA